MGLASAHHSCDALFMDAWLQALDRGATRHNVPDAASMLEALPPMQGALRNSAQSLHTKGVADAESLDNLLASSRGGLAKKWRRDICCRLLTQL